MAWRDQLGKVKFSDGRELVGASFRGVVFYVETAERSGGRRTVVHEYPGRDNPYVDDMGRKARGFNVEGYVLGASYLAERDLLVDALEGAGPGELVHPNYGTLLVACSGFRVRESSSEGGMARFSIEFEETAASAPFPEATVAAEAAVGASVDEVLIVLSSEFEATYSVEGQPAHALESLSALIAEAAAAVDAALAPLVLATQDLATLKHDLDQLVLDADALVRQPFLIAGRLVTSLVALTNMPLRPSLGISALLEAYGVMPTSVRPPATTSTRATEQANWDALLGLIRTTLAVQAARLAAAEAFPTYDQAVASRDDVAAALDEQAETAGDDTYAALSQLRADLVRAVPGEASDLPRLVRHTPVATVPSLVLAHRLYGDLSREADLVTRNRVERPGFVPGGVELEVLSRG